VPAFAQTDSDINGTRTSHGFAVSDGDTVKFGKQLIRLFGFDAPEKLQPCDDGKWFPGPMATTALIRIIAGRPVSCRQVDYDRKNNRPVAQCYAGEDDLQEQMVLAGWAWAYTQYDRYLVDC
jgi:endonuclease YncB( thermonuclease family)